MSGHSKWATIKRKKGAADAKRGRIFTRLIKEITIAARDGGGDADSNPRLRTAISSAKSENMPLDNIERAIKRGTGELEGVTYDESWYEAYGPGGIAIYIQTLTDNKNRTVAEIRHILVRHNTNMAEAGSVAWMFDQKGVIEVESDAIDEDELMEIVLESGAEDMEEEDNSFQITTEPGDLEAVRSALEEKGIKYVSAEVKYIPKNLIEIDVETGTKALKLIDALEEHDDVQNLYTNADFPDELLEEE